MKKLKYLLLVSVLAVLASCSSKDAFVDIDSVSKKGDTFFGGQNVPVWVCVTTDDYMEAEYKWTCSGGSFYGPTDVFRANWIAPRVKGTYTVTCTVTSNGKSQSRSTEMVVDGYFVENFSTTVSGDFKKSSVTATQDIVDNFEMKLTATSSTATGRYYRGISDAAFGIPYTFSTDMAWRSDYTNDTVPVRVANAFNIPVPMVDEDYISVINLDIYPTLPAEGVASPHEDDPAFKFTNNVVLSFNSVYIPFSKTTTITAFEGFLPEFAWEDGSLSADGKGMKNVKIEVTDDYTMKVYVEGKEVITSSALKEYMASTGLTDKLTMSSFSYYLRKGTTLYIDDIELDPYEYNPVK